MTIPASAHRPFAAQPGSGWLVGAAIAAAALVSSVAQMTHGGIPGSADHGADLDALGILLAAVASVPLLAWHRAPMGVFVVTAAGSALLAGLGYPLGLPLGPTAALYLLAAGRAEEQPWTSHTTVATAALFGAYLGAIAAAQEAFPVRELFHTGLAWTAAWFAGERTRLRHEHVAELAGRAMRTERDAERERLLATAEERARIARDLHDSAGHAINVIAVRAGAARLRADPERSQAALEAIEELARKTVGEIDQIVGTLRDRGSETGVVDAPPGLASLDSLVERHTAAGLDVSVVSEGERRPLGSAVNQAAFRILQESLTNAARHGSGPARVELRFGDTALELIVSNAAESHSLGRSNGGHGLIGMRERAALLGGDLDIERANGSFSVRIWLPYEGRSS